MGHSCILLMYAQSKFGLTSYKDLPTTLLMLYIKIVLKELLCVHTHHFLKLTVFNFNVFSINLSSVVTLLEGASP